MKHKRAPQHERALQPTMAMTFSSASYGPLNHHALLLPLRRHRRFEMHAAGTVLHLSSEPPGQRRTAAGTAVAGTGRHACAVAAAAPSARRTWALCSSTCTAASNSAPCEYPEYQALSMLWPCHMLSRLLLITPLVHLPLINQSAGLRGCQGLLPR